MISSVEKHYLPDENDVDVFQNIYKVTYSDNTVSYVPHNTDNTDYQAIQDWIAAGNSVVDPNE